MELVRMMIDKFERAVFFRDHKVLHTNLADLVENYKRWHNYFGSSVVLNVADRMNFWHILFINKNKFVNKSAYTDAEVVCNALHASYPEVFKDPDIAYPEIYTNVESWINKEVSEKIRSELRMPSEPARRKEVAILRKILTEYGNRPVVIRFKDFGY